MTRHPKNRKASSSIESIPNEVLICEILGRVASSSFTDLFNFKLSGKIFNAMAEDKHVYQCVSLDNFPIIPWDPLSEKQKTFLTRCREFENPEVMYRQAVLDYFNRSNLRSTCKHLQKAVKLGHIGALYVTCIILLTCGDHDSKEIGIKMLSDLKKSKRKIRLCRNNLIKILRQMWVKNPILKEPPTCCSTPNQHQWRNRCWFEDDENSECEACNADREIKFICSTYNYY